MSKIIHEILSKVHDLLSISTPEDLRIAANHAGNSINLRTALEALAIEREATSKPGRSKSNSNGKKINNKSRKPAGFQKANLSEADQPSFRFLENTSKEEIVELARLLGIELQVARKDARSRILRRLEKAVRALPNDKRQQVLVDLAAGIDEQTSGWVDVIKKGK